MNFPGARRGAVGLPWIVGFLLFGVQSSLASPSSSLRWFLGWAVEAGPAGVVREIDDPQSGARWLLLRDRSHPGGPGRLVQVRPGDVNRIPDGLTPVRRALPIIRVGDRVRVEEHSTIADAVLDAIALSPAAAGEIFRVRMALGGRVVHVIATAPGRAALASKAEASR